MAKKDESKFLKNEKSGKRSITDDPAYRKRVLKSQYPNLTDEEVKKITPKMNFF